MEVDGLPLNLKVLDEIVLNYAAHEGLIWVRGADCQELASLRTKREAIEHICRTTNEGDIEEAIALTEKCNAGTLEDQKLLFQLHKQQFLEHLRAGFDEKAIQCSRKFLEPLALNAYLEAYQDFKQVMLAFLFGPDDINSPIAEQWSLKQRSQLAGTVAADLRSALAAYDPLLSLLLRYLVSIQRRSLELAGNLQPSPRLERVLHEIPFAEKDPPLLPKSTLNRAPDFKEKDVQDLAHAVELPRQAAVDSLRVADGDVLMGLKNEVSRMRVNRTFVDELAREYLVYRGQLECDCDSAPHNLTGKGDQDPRRMHTCDASIQSIPSLGNAGGTTENERLDPFVPSQSVSEDPASSTGRQHLQGSEPSGACIANGCRTIAGHLCPNGRTIDEDAAATERDQDGDVQMGEAHNGDQAEGAQGHSGASPPDPLRVWRGRPEGFRERHDRALGLHLEHVPTFAAAPSMAGDCPVNAVPGVAEPGCPAMPSHAPYHASAERWSSSSASASASASSHAASSSSSSTAAMPSAPLRHGNVDEYLGTTVLGADVAHRYRKVLEIRKLASAGDMGAAVDASLLLIPDFFKDKPELLFQLMEVEFVKLLDAGEYKLALRLARDTLGPLAAAHRDLLPALKATLLAFAKPDIHHPNTPPTTAALATALQESLAAAVGVPEPLLMVLMRSLIDAHDEWFDMQMCADPFRGFFRLDALKSDEGDGSAAALETMVEGAEMAQSSGEQSVADESILTLMEFLAISRGDAVLLLEKFDGSVEAVFADKLGGD